MKRWLIALLAFCLIPISATAVESEIKIVPGSTINLVAREANIPISIENGTSESAVVTLKAVATSFRLEVTEFVKTEIPANTSVVVELPVQALANGPTQLKAWIVKDGKKLNDFVYIDVNVNYDIELFLIVSMGAVLVVLVTLGGIRTARKLRRSQA